MNGLDSTSLERSRARVAVRKYGTHGAADQLADSLSITDESLHAINPNDPASPTDVVNLAATYRMIAAHAIALARLLAVDLDLERESRENDLVGSRRIDRTEPVTIWRHRSPFAEGPLDSGPILADRRSTNLPRAGHDRRDHVGLIAYAPARRQWEFWSGAQCHDTASTSEALRVKYPRASFHDVSEVAQ